MLPVIRTLQQGLPGCRLTWIIGKSEYPLVEGLEGVEFIIFDKRAGWRAYADLRRQLRGRRFDALLHMQAALRASLISLLIRAPLRIGFDRERADDAQWLFSNRKITTPPRRHVLDVFLGFAEALGVTTPVMRWDVPIPASAREAMQARLAGPRPLLTINPCTSVRKRNYRNWHASHYAAVADYASRELGYQVVLTGGPADNEKQMAQAIMQAAETTPINLVGQTSIKELLAVLSLSELIIAPDTGPAHMGTAVGTPVIGLYVTSNPLRTGPYNDLDKVVNRYPDALENAFGKGVDEVDWGRRVRDPAAIDLITVDEVTERLHRVTTALRAQA
ncbi:glycosyltransferase family 9 protein [Granulosicoccaceae sp. 1_MG-2023]|nr:glycosyltransferase family 9 protein [Granulosicoccaceae sp. 1_MG-2023]